MKTNDWKDRLNVVYSTNPEYSYEKDANHPPLPAIKPAQQNLRVMLDKKHRGGKTVTLVTGFVGTEDQLKELGKTLKAKCGAGGAVKDGEIMVQGDFKQRIFDLLKAEGYLKTKLAGG